MDVEEEKVRQSVARNGILHMKFEVNLDYLVTIESDEAPFAKSKPLSLFLILSYKDKFSFWMFK